MKFTVKQGMLTAYGVLDVDIPYNSNDFPESFIKGLQDECNIVPFGAIADNRGTNIFISGGEDKLDIELDTFDIDYIVEVSPGWNTNWWITNKTVKGCTINFGRPAPIDGATTDWFLVE